MAPRARDSAAAAPLALAPAPTDELAGYDLPADADDGLDEISGEDLKMATRLLNMKGTGPDGRKIPEDEFYDTIDENTTREVDAVFLYLHKSNLYSYFDNEKSSTEIVCRSFDRITGTMEKTGVERPCKGCPDDQWYTDNGKRRKNCGAVYSTACLDRTTRMPFWFRFKRTSLPVFKQYMQRHHLGRRPMGSKRANYPLYAFHVRLSAKMSENGKYALPVLTRGDVLAPEEMRECLDACSTIKANLKPLLAQADAAAASSGEGGGESDGGGGGATDFNYGANDPGVGKDFVE